MNPRYHALARIEQRERRKPLDKSRRPSEIFGDNVFNDKMMKHYLSSEAYTSLKNCIEARARLDRALAGPVANAIKAWAMDKGATHYTHWFLPLTGRTAEKHNSFLEISEGEAIDKFSGDELSQQEPDASSFPSGGYRSTFEARGYTAWDSSSPIFIFETTYGRTLCIPTIFVSFTGEALDFKIPLLKSIGLLDKAATAICEYFDKDVKRVYPTLGYEQEYYLIDRTLYNLRPDLMMCGRTVFGSMLRGGTPQLDDRYFGAIHERVYAFMNDLELQAHRLGIPLKTRHNEVSPSQFECVPKHENLNVAVDHGLMVMDLIERIARKHNLAAILHEKPFFGLNGSGKHNNWSLVTDTGKNVLAPGSDPQGNLMFLAFFSSVIKGVHDHADLLRASIASPGNDLRLGSDEAPPAIMSVFVGRRLNKILNDIENPPRKRKHEPENELLRLGISEIPELLIDNTDRNRTSPFAFTGNKFEFRAVGSSANSSSPMTILNTIVADQLIEFRKKVDSKIRRGRNMESAVLDIIKENISESTNIRFEGDGYSNSWFTEAEKRGLKNIRHTAYALDAYATKSTASLFQRTKVYSPEELTARYEILLGDFLSHLKTEGELIYELAVTQVIPAAVNYQNELLKSVKMTQDAGLKNVAATAQGDLALVIGEKLNQLFGLCEKLSGTRRRIEKRGYNREMAVGYTEQVLPIFDEIRVCVDALEGWVADEYWPLPKYRELLFVK